MKFAPKVIGDEKLDSWYPCSFNSSQPYVTGVGQSAIQGLYPPSVAVAIGSPGNLHLNPASVSPTLPPYKLEGETEPATPLPGYKPCGYYDDCIRVADRSRWEYKTVTYRYDTTPVREQLEEWYLEEALDLLKIPVRESKLESIHAIMQKLGVGTPSRDQIASRDQGDEWRRCIQVLWWRYELAQETTAADVLRRVMEEVKTLVNEGGGVCPLSPNLTSGWRPS